MKKLIALAAAVAGAVWFSKRRNASQQQDPWATHSDAV